MKPTICRSVIFIPLADCAQDQQYPAIVSQVNADDSLELATFGPNSLYFQHKVKPFDVDHPELGGWIWPPRA